MKEFLLYIHKELSRLLDVYKSGEKLSVEDEGLLNSIISTLSVLEHFAETSKDNLLYRIFEDMEYSTRHLWVSFKAEAALKEAEKNINSYI